MTPRDDQQPGLDQVTLSVHGADTGREQLGIVAALYAEIYAERPYHEGADDVADFTSGWSKRTDQPNFRLVVAHRLGEAVGFGFGHRLGAQTRWWDGALTALPADITTEWPGRTFAIIELAVRQAYRRRGVARQLHDHVTAGLSEQRVTLLVRPDAPAPQHAYSSWGYQQVGRIQPFSSAPTYDAMIKSLV